MQSPPWARPTTLISFLCLSFTGLALPPTLPAAPQSQDPTLETQQDPDSETMPQLVEETVVTASHSLDRSTPVKVKTLDQQRILELPHFGDDPFRALRVLPGITAGELSARFGVRGTQYEDIDARIDGVELFAPFHLLDFEGVFSILDAENLDRINFVPSTYTSQYGDRFGGVLEMSTSTPTQDQYRIGLSLSNASLAASQRHGDRFGWFASARRGYIDQLVKVADSVDPDGDDGDPDEESDDSTVKPTYWDSFVRGDLQISDRQSLTLGALVSDDDLDLTDDEDGFTEVVTGYGNKSFWLKHEAMVGARSHISTTLSQTSLMRNRDIVATDDDDSFDLTDRRDLTVQGLRHEGATAFGDHHYLSFGFEARRFESTTDYSNTIGFSEVIRDPRFLRGADDFTRLRAEAETDHLSAWVSDRWRLGSRLTVELGARFDQQRRDLALGDQAAVAAPDDDQFSPRLNAVLDLDGIGLLRAGWGYFYQSQRPHELPIEFGSTERYAAEKQQHFTLGWSKHFSPRLSLRADAYLRRSDNPNPRFTALFSQSDAFSELREDIFFAAPESFEATGIELFAEGRLGRKMEWSAGYTYSKAEETYEGSQGRFTRPRYSDQPHAVNLSWVYRPSDKWAFNLVWYYHTGWPTTRFDATVDLLPGQQGDDVDLVDMDFDIGPFYGERLPAYHRLDVRVTRTVNTRRGSLSFYLDIQDLYDRDNVAGVDLGEAEFIPLGDGRFQVVFAEEQQLGLLPSFGMTWKF